MNRHVLKSSLFCLLVSIINLGASTCNYEDIKTAQFWDNYYTPDEAYNFGIKIKKTIKNKDSSGLISLINGELDYGPRKQYVLSNPFDKIFPPKFQKSILNSSSPCSPIGWRGFMMSDPSGDGVIWFNKINDNWEIFSIIGAKEEKDSFAFGLKFNQHVLKPKCFIPQNDRTSEKMKKYEISNKEKFISSPGLYYGKEIKNFKSFIPADCHNNENCSPVDTIKLIPNCSSSNLQITNSYGLFAVTESNEFFETEYGYKVIKNLSTNLCAQLAPNLAKACHECYFISVGENSGGSIGWMMSYGIYGIFDDPSSPPFIIPLKFFKNKNIGLNFIHQYYSEDY